MKDQEPFNSFLKAIDPQDRAGNFGGDNRQQNTPAEIYRNVRNNALEDAAIMVEAASRYSVQNPIGHYEGGDYIQYMPTAAAIRALKTEAE